MDTKEVRTKGRKRRGKTARVRKRRKAKFKEEQKDYKENNKVGEGKEKKRSQESRMKE